jgi:phosphate transport system ATP-binding protein
MWQVHAAAYPEPDARGDSRCTHVKGSVQLDGTDLYGSGVDPVAVRRVVGMVFQRPNPFPSMSIFDNVASGLTLNGVKNKKILTEAWNAH